MKLMETVNELRCKRGLCTKLHRAKPCTVPRLRKKSAVDSLMWRIATYSLSPKLSSPKATSYSWSEICNTAACGHQWGHTCQYFKDWKLFVLEGNSFAGWCWVGFPWHLLQEAVYIVGSECLLSTPRFHSRIAWFAPSPPCRQIQNRLQRKTQKAEQFLPVCTSESHKEPRNGYIP